MPDERDLRPDEQEIAIYQAALAELLSSGQSLEAILENLKTDSRFENFRHHINEFDPDMVEVACELMGKWAVRNEQPPDT